MEPIVTIGVCVRNCASTIKEVIECILNQEYPRELMEIIFVDDGSTDGTLSIIKECISKLNVKVKIFHHKWKGLGISRNIVVNNAEGKYIVWVDGNIKLSKDYLKAQVNLMENNRAIGVAKGKYGISNDGSYVSFLENIPFFIFTNKYAGKLIKTNPGTGGAIYRVKAIREVGGFDNHMTGAYEDMDAEERMRKRGWLICVSHATFYKRYPSTWAYLWTKYFWYGYGAGNFYSKNRNNMKICYMLPISAFISGIFYAIDAYKVIRRKMVFLLPIQFIYKMSAWWLGFIKYHVNHSS